MTLRVGTRGTFSEQAGNPARDSCVGAKFAEIADADGDSHSRCSQIASERVLGELYLPLICENPVHASESNLHAANRIREIALEPLKTATNQAASRKQPGSKLVPDGPPISLRSIGVIPDTQAVSGSRR